MMKRKVKNRWSPEPQCYGHAYGSTHRSPQAKHRLFSFRAHQVHKPLAWAYRWPEECDPLDLIEHAKCMAVTDAPHW